MGRDLSGQLLVAVPQLLDPNFHQSVVLIIEHSREGAFGVILNRPTDLDLEAALAGAPGSQPSVVFEGGPVVREGALALGRTSSPVAGWSPIPVLGDTGMVDVEHALEHGWPDVSALRIFAGHAGWSASQLDTEVSEDGGWVVVPAQADDVFTSDPSGLYIRALERAGGARVLYGFIPRDPGMN